MDPGGHRERVVVGEVRDVARIDEAPAVEAHRLADPPGRKARLAVHQRDVHGQLGELRLPGAPQPGGHGGRDVDRLRGIDARDVAVERVVHQEPIAQHPVDTSRGGKRGFPLPLSVGRLGLEARERLADRGELLVEFGQLGELLVGRGRDVRGRVAVLERLAPLGDVVEVGEDLVELPLRERVELVVVAARAPEGQAHPDRPGGRNAVDHVLHQELLGDDAPLAVLAVVPVEGGGDALVEGGVREHVAGELLEGEPIERHVGVVGVDHPVAVAPHGPLGVGLVAARVGVPGAVQPLDGHPLAVGRGAQQPVDRLLVGVWRVVVQKGRDISRGRRQPGQVERHPAEERRAVGFRRGSQALGLEAGEDEAVDGVAPPLAVGDRRQGRALRRDERPVRPPLGPLIDPQPEGLDLLGRQRVGVRAGRHRRVQTAPIRHPQPVLGGGDPMEKEAVRRVPGDDGRAAELAPIGERPLLHVEPQAALP